MGGCCCCIIKDVEPQRALEEVVPLSLQNGFAPAASLGLLINTNLETSVADACMPLPAPVPHNVVVEHPHPHTADDAVEVDGNKTDASVRTANSVSVEELVGGNNQENAEKDEDPKLSESKAPSLILETENVSKIEISEKADQFMASMEECPTCLEEYDDDNPKIITKCKHHFHLACILEWMEWSDTCPVCNKEMKFSSLQPVEVKSTCDRGERQHSGRYCTLPERKKKKGADAGITR